MRRSMYRYALTVRSLLGRGNQRKRVAAKRHLKYESLEQRTLFSTTPLSSTATTVAVESINGTGNNLTHTSWGSVNTDLLRIAAAAYTDGISSPAGADR